MCSIGLFSVWTMESASFVLNLYCSDRNTSYVNVLSVLSDLSGDDLGDISE